MKYRLDNLHTELKKVTLEKSEKEVIRRAVLSVVLGKSAQARKHSTVLSPFYSKIESLTRGFTPSSFVWYRFFRSSTYVSAFVIISLILGGSVSLAAERSLPGDALYGVKTDVNEKVQAFFIDASHESQANFQAKLAVKRVEEAEKLAVAGRLDDTTKAKIITGIEKHTTAFKAEVQKLSADKDYAKAITAASGLESSFKAHETVLLAVEATTSSSTALALPPTTTPVPVTRIDENGMATTTIQPVVSGLSETSVIGQVQATLSDVQTTRIVAQDKVKTEETPGVIDSANSALDSAQKAISDTQTYLENLKTKISPSAYADSLAKLTFSQHLFEIGKAQIDSQLYGDAFVSFQDALKKATEIKVSFEAANTLDINADRLIKDQSTGGRPR